MQSSNIVAQLRVVAVACVAFAICCSKPPAEVPLPFTQLQEPATLGVAVHSAVDTVSGGYHLAGYRAFSGDSILLVYDDPALTSVALRANTWTFGPPVTAAEADGCPPPKVLGRKIARELWRALGRPKALQQVMIAVRGTEGIDRYTAETMFYYPQQLEGPWVGDPRHP